MLILGLYFVRYGQSTKYFSQDGQYSFYSKRSIGGISLVNMPGDGDTGGGTIYVYDEIEKNVIYKFESSWLRADIEASEFSSYDGGVFNCKSGHFFHLPRQLKKIKSFHYQTKKIKSGLNIDIEYNLERAQRALHIYKSPQENGYLYFINIPERKISIETHLIIIEKTKDYLNITLDSIVNIAVKGNTVGYWKAPNKVDIDFAEKLTKNDIENLFREQIKIQTEKK